MQSAEHSVLHSGHGSGQACCLTVIPEIPCLFMKTLRRVHLAGFFCSLFNSFAGCNLWSRQPLIGAMLHAGQATQAVMDTNAEQAPASRSLASSSDSCSAVRPLAPAGTMRSSVGSAGAGSSMGPAAAVSHKQLSSCDLLVPSSSSS